MNHLPVVCLTYLDVVYVYVVSFLAESGNRFGMLEEQYNLLIFLRVWLLLSLLRDVLD